MKFDISELSTEELEMLITDGIAILVARDRDADLFVGKALEDAQYYESEAEKPRWSN